MAEPYIPPLPSAAPGPLVPQATPELAPIRSEHCANDTEADLNDLFARVLEATLRPALRDINTLAMPQLGSNEQFELAANRSGLGIYRRSDDEAMRLLYRAWMGQNPRRGLHMLRLYLRLLFPGGWTCDQLWHPADKTYPTALNKTGGPGQFLTSRVEVTIQAEDMDETDVLRILPALLSVTPARIVLDINIQTKANYAPLRIAAAASAVGISIFSARATTAQEATASLPGDIVAAAASLGFMLLRVDAVATPAATPTPTPTPTPPPPPPPSIDTTPTPPPPTPPPPPPPPPPAAQDAVSNPVTSALSGIRTFNVTTDEELDAVPFYSLTAGDVVNIHYKATPYKRLFRVRSSGTEFAPILIWGVTDASGNRPVFSGDGARVATGALDCFLPYTYPTSWADREAMALIGTAIAPGDNYMDRPKYVRFENLEVLDVRHGLPYTDALGAPHTWDQASGMRIQDGADIVFENCVLHDCDYGAFSQVNNIDAAHAALRPVLRNCRIYNCGMVGRSTEHGAYWQGISPVIEGNYFGPVRAGSYGASLKTRASDLVLRYNWIESSYRAVDIVHSEDSWTGVQASERYGVSHVYGNVICNDWTRLGVGAAYPMHLGGDNMGEDGPVGSAFVTDASLTDSRGNMRVYQHTMYCWGNTFVFRSALNQTYNASWFDLSLSGTATQPRTTVHEWNNAVLMEGTTEWAQLRNAGHIEHLGGTIAQVTGTLANAHHAADPAKWSLNGTLSTGSLGLTDYRVTTGAAPIDTPALPTSFRTELAAATSQPRVLTNGMAPATVSVIGAIQPATAAATSAQTTVFPAYTPQ